MKKINKQSRLMRVKCRLDRGVASQTKVRSGFVPILLRCMGRIPLHQRRS